MDAADGYALMGIASLVWLIVALEQLTNGDVTLSLVSGAAAVLFFLAWATHYWNWST